MKEITSVKSLLDSRLTIVRVGLSIYMFLRESLYIHIQHLKYMDKFSPFLFLLQGWRATESWKCLIQVLTYSSLFIDYKFVKY